MNIKMSGANFTVRTVFSHLLTLPVPIPDEERKLS